MTTAINTDTKDCCLNNNKETEQEQVLNELQHFTGTQSYYKANIFSKLVLTDGMQYLRLKLNCFWLIDIVASVQGLAGIKKNSSLIVWKIKVNEDKSFIVKAFRDYDKDKTEQENEQEYLLYKQGARHTDFILNEFEFYQCDNVLLLKSEY